MVGLDHDRLPNRLQEQGADFSSCLEIVDQIFPLLFVFADNHAMRRHLTSHSFFIHADDEVSVAVLHFANDYVQFVKQVWLEDQSLH